ncbi:MAG: hypothetical protein GDA36_01425 [Rhodobacteraceae bacterium]|nr:hypothetical protein [Paracoccaceae bacterium]
MAEHCWARVPNLHGLGIRLIPQRGNRPGFRYHHLLPGTRGCPETDLASCQQLRIAFVDSDRDDGIGTLIIQLLALPF